MNGAYLACSIVALFLSMAIILPGSSLSTRPRAPSVDATQESWSISTAGLYGVNWTASPPDGNNGWYRNPVTLTCTYDSGIIAEVDYRYTGTGWQVYTNPVIISEEGVIEFEWYCVYNNGTVSRPQGPFRYGIDRTPPEVEVEKERIGWKKYEISAEVDDGLSGLDRIEWWIGPYLQYTQTFTDPSGEQTAVWILSPIPHIQVTIRVVIYDLAGNNNSWNITASLTLSLPTALHLLQDTLQWYQAKTK